MYYLCVAYLNRVITPEQFATFSDALREDAKELIALDAGNTQPTINVTVTGENPGKAVGEIIDKLNEALEKLDESGN